MDGTDKMPYINPKPRELFDPIVYAMRTKCRLGLYEELKEERDALTKTLQALEIDNPMETDGAFNYFITKLLIVFGWIDPDMGYYDTMGSPIGKVLEEFIFSVMDELYYPPKYYRYNRAMGMLLCCRKEFNKVFEKEAACVNMLLNKLMDRFYDEIIYPYENKKRDENGQVTK